MTTFMRDFINAGNNDRAVIALERIAEALDRMAPPKLSKSQPETKSPPGGLIETTNEDLCRMEDEEEERKAAESSPQNP